MTDRDEMDPASLQKRAEESIKKGDRSAWMNFLGPTKEEAYHMAADDYMAASNILRNDGRYMEAGQMHEKAAGVFIMMREKIKDGDWIYQAGDQLAEASKDYVSANDHPTAIKCLDEAVALFKKKGNFNRAARLSDLQGDMYLNQFGNSTKAIECYKEAVRMYWAENHQSSSIGIKQKLAELLVSGGQYAEAMQAYQEVGKYWCSPKKNYSSAWSSFANALFCAMAIDRVTVPRMLDEINRDSHDSTGKVKDFVESPEGQAVSKLLTFLLAEDWQAFWQLCESPKLNDLQRSILWVARSKIADHAEDFS